MKMIILSLIMAFVLPVVAQAHSGGTNSSGCHRERATGGYHCH